MEIRGFLHRFPKFSPLRGQKCDLEQKIHILCSKSTDFFEFDEKKLATFHKFHHKSWQISKKSDIMSESSPGSKIAEIIINYADRALFGQKKVPGWAKKLPDKFKKRRFFQNTLKTVFDQFVHCFRDCDHF